MALFIPITKVDAERRLVYGTLSEETRDKSDEILDYATAKPAFEKWSDEIKEVSGGKSLGNVRAMHGAIAAGKLTDINYDDDAKRIEGCAKIVDDNEWLKVCEGVYTGFSIGGGYAKRWPDKDNPALTRYTPTLAEVSIVDNPCVPTATFDLIRADGSIEMRKFITPSHKEDSMDPKALAAAKEALAKGTATDEQKALIAKADADALLKAAQDADAKGEATDEQKALLAKAAEDGAKVMLVKDGKPVKPKSAPVQKWLANDGAPFDSKREAEVHNLHLEKQTELAPGLAQMDALLKAAKKPVDEDEDEEGDDEETKKAKKNRREEKAAKAKEKTEKDDAEMAAKKEKEDKEAADKAAGAAALQKKDYSDKERKEMADKKEALPDGSFPIKTKKDLENAIQAFGRAKDKDKAKAHIKARAKALGAEDMLPEDWSGKKPEKAARKGKLEKGLHQVGWLAHMLDELTRFQDSVEIEQYFEDDKESELPAKLKSIVSEFCELLVTLVQEETEELAEGNDEDVIVLEMAAGLPEGHPGAIAKFARAKAEPLSKSDSKKESEAGAALIKLAETLEKAGARHSKADAERVQALHDHAEDVHKCMGEMVEKCADMHKGAAEAKNTAIDLGAKGERAEDEEDEPASKSAVKMSKALDALAESKVEVGALTKVIAKMDVTLNEAVGVMKAQQASIETLSKEKSEIAERVEHLEKQPAAPKGHVRAISKTQDSGAAGGETEAEYKARLAKLSPAEKSRELMKLAMSNPMELPAL
jgi:hypothetical protein